MATNRTVELQLKVQGATTLAEMEQNLEEINEELKTLDTNSKAFKDLAATARQADQQVTELNDSLVGVASQDQVDGFVRLGAGIVGAFSAVEGLSAAFGTNSEELEKTLVKLEGYVAALEGIKSVTEAVNAENRKFLRAAIDGFKKSAIGAKLFGTATKTALTATGILAFVVILGTLIANWEDVTKAVRDFAKTIPFLDNFIKSLDKVIAKVGSLGNLLQAIGAGIKGLFTSGKSFADEFTKALEQGLLSRRVDKALKNIEKRQDTINSKTAQYQADLDRINRSYVVRETQLKNQLSLEDSVAKQKAIQRDLDELAVARQREITAKTLEFNEKNRVDIEKQIKQLEATITAQQSIVDLEIKKRREKEDVVKAEEEIVKILDKREKLDVKANKNAKELNELLQGQNGDILINLERANRAFEERSKIEQFSTLGLISVLDKIDQTISEGVVPDDLLETFVKLKLENQELAEQYQKIETSLFEQGKILDERDVKTKKEIEEQEKLNTLLQTRSDLEELLLSAELEKIQLKLLQDTLSKKERDELNILLGLLDDELKRLRIIEEFERREVRRREFKLKLIQLEADINKRILAEYQVGQKNIDTADEKLIENQRIRIANTNILLEKNAEEARKRLAAASTILKLTKLKNLEDKKGADASTVFNDELLKQTEELGKELEKFGEAAFLGFEAGLVGLDNALIEYNKNFDKATTELEAFYEKAIDYEELLKDANGERYDEISKAQKKQAEDEYQLLKAKVDAENRIISAENQQAKIQKAQAVVSSIIQTALAVVQALPNVPLSIISGVLGAANTGIILAQKIPFQEKIPQPTKGFAEGGFTGEGGKHQPAGIVHKGEYVVPQSIMQTKEGARMAETLEAMRTRGMKGYADGGLVTAPDSVGNVDSQTQQVVNALENAKIYVSVEEINSVNTNVRVIQSKASL